MTLGNGKVFVASGVEKLVKPVYPDHPRTRSRTSARPRPTIRRPASGPTTGARRQRSLPLFPRLHLLPNGHVYYNAAGQSFNPFGQSYDEALWNIAASYDPATGRWKDLGIPGVDGGLLGGLLDLDFGQPVSDLAKLGIPGGGKSLTLPGFRGSTFSLMLPLQPDAAGRYTKASFLTAGGVLNPPSPGSYFSTSDSRITTVDTRAGTPSRPSRRATCTGRAGTPPASSCRPARRWPSPARTATRWLAGHGVPDQAGRALDPQTGDWPPVAQGHQPRTYHNSAALLPDGRILIGGHAPITTLYLRHITLRAAFSPNERDPSFELYSPPYLFRGARPQIVSAPSTRGYGGQHGHDGRPAGDGDRERRARAQPAETHVSTPTSATWSCGCSGAAGTG